MKQHANTIARSCFDQMRQLRSVRRSLTFDALHTLVHALINSKLDYCNAVLYGAPVYAVRHLQPYWTPLRASSLALDSTSTSLPYFVTRCTGCLSLSALTTRLHWWPTAASMVRVQPTSTASVVQSHLSRAVRCWGQPTTENLLSPKLEESATVHAASVLLHHLCGTIYHDISETMTLVVNNSLAIWRHFCLHGPTCQRYPWERLFKMCKVLYKWTYLLTYLIALQGEKHHLHNQDWWRIVVRRWLHLCPLQPTSPYRSQMSLVQSHSPGKLPKRWQTMDSTD